MKNISGQIFKKTGKLVKLSEQQLLDCARGPKYSRNKGDIKLFSMKRLRNSKTHSGCNGGVVSLVYDYIKVNGVTRNVTYPYPYQAVDNLTCSYNSSTSVSKLKSYVWPQNIDENYLKDLLTFVGPIAVRKI